ncbi:hypothetical protein TorRG33x02_182680 [Trema orientale]|uniref:Uncharacterized protein n=1 Tax=Trema orientale TaxID=63057 RepID=A0A2P5EKA8_TREOI|nr:hypothetical protein TorRG33x02_182680 [Trema orientale]
MYSGEASKFRFYFESKAIGVWKGITFVTLVDKLYEVIGVDKNRFDLELKVVYKCGGGDGIPIPPTKITTDSDLELWLEEMSYSIKNRTPLCVSILPKFRAVGEGCSQNASFVPETDAEKIEAQEVDPTLPAAAACPPEICPPIRNDSDNYYDWGFGAENIRPEELKECFGEVPKTPGTTPWTSSSRVRRVRIVDNAAKWSAPLFSAGELPIKVKDEAIANYLEEIGIEKWSRANFSAIRYNIMTSNNAESFNNMSRDARKYPITTLAEFLIRITSNWLTNLNDNCTWRLRARKVEQSDMFEVRR